MHSENSTGYFDLCFNGCETNLKQKVTWSKHTLSHCISRGTVRLKGLVYRVWSLVMSHACPEHGGWVLESSTHVTGICWQWRRGHAEWGEWDGSCGFTARILQFLKVRWPWIHVPSGHFSLLSLTEMPVRWHASHGIVCFWRAIFLGHISKPILKKP